MQKILSFYKGEGPWGKKGSGGSSKEGGNNRRRPSGRQEPDIEDVIRNAQERVKKMMGGGGRGGNGGGADVQLPNLPFLPLAIVLALVFWVYQCTYVVGTDEEGVVTRFGKYVETTTEGLHFRLWPLEDVDLPKVTRENIVEVGFRSAVAVQTLMGRAVRRVSNDKVVDIPEESLMLTGDENIVDLDFTVRWKIADARDYLFNVAGVEETVKHVAESAMREVIGRYPIDDAITNNRYTIQQDAMQLMQEVLDGYKIGVQINGVELQGVQPPQPVINAFRDVQAAKADAEKFQDQAIGYANDVVPGARGQAAQILQEAAAYKASQIASATGAADRFNQQLVEYRKAPEVTRRRLYLETMEKVLKSSRTVIMGSQAGQGVLPYLPLQQTKGGR